MSNSSLYSLTNNVSVSSNNFTTLYNTSTGNVVTKSVPDSNFTTLYGQSNTVIATNTTYGNANVAAFLNQGTDGPNTISNITLSGNLVAGGNVTAQNFIGNFSGNISGNVANANYANFAGNAYSVTLSNVVGAGNIASLNLNGSNSQVLYGNGVFASVGNGNYAVNANFANYAGNVTVSNQPNITSVGTLPNLNVGNVSITGNIDGNLIPNANITYNLGNATNQWKDLYLAGNSIHLGSQLISSNVNGISVTNNLYANYFVGSGNNLSNIQYSNISGLGNIATVNLNGSNSQVLYGNGVFASVGNGNYAVNANYANYAGNAFSVAVANVTGIGNIATLNLNGNGNTFLSGNGTFSAIANANYANVADTAYNVSGSNVIGAVNLASYASTANAVAGANVSGAVLLANYAYAVAGANVTGAVAYANVANVANLVTGGNVSGQVANALIASTVYTNAQPNITSVGTLSSVTVSGNITGGNANLGNLAKANYFQGSGNLLSNIQAANITGSVTSATTANFANFAGNVTVASQPNITSLGTLSSLSVTGNITSGNVTANLYGNASGVTGLSLTGTNFTDVSVTSPTNQQILQYNGSTWVNNTLTIPTSAGSGVSFWFTSPTVLPTGSNNITQLDTLNSTPNTSAIQYATQIVNSTTSPVMGTVSLPLGRTQFDAGNWDFAIWANANSTGGTSTIQPCVYQVNPGTGTVSITGTGTSRTATASSGTPFLNSVGSATVTAASFLQTAQGLFQITAKSSNTVVTINVPSTYTNESSVSYFVYDLFFTIAPKTITNILSEYIFTNTTDVLAVQTTTRLGVIVIATTSATKLISITYNDTTQASHLSTPFITLHDNLAGLQGGQSTEYYHLTNSEYTGTGSGVFARQTSPVFTTPNIGDATGTSLNISGNIITVNANLGNAVRGNYFIGSGNNLSNIVASNITGTVANANYSAYAGNATIANSANSVSGSNVSGQVANALIAGTVYTNAQPNITSVGTLTTLNISGNITTGNANLGNAAVANFFTGNGYYLNSIPGANIIGTAPNANFSTYAGTVLTNAQPNITSVGTLNGLTLISNGATTPTIQLQSSNVYYTEALNITGTWANNTNSFALLGGVLFNVSLDSSNLANYSTIQVASFGVIGKTPVTIDSNSNVSANYFLGNGHYLTGISGINPGSNTQVIFNDGGTSNGNANLTFNKSNGALIVGGNLTVNGNIIGNGYYITYITGANVNGTVPTANNANYASYSGTAGYANSVAGANVSGQVSNALVAGTVYTNAQPNITSVGTLTSLSVIGNISSGNANLGNLVIGNFFSGSGNLLSNLQASNITGTIANANYSAYSGIAGVANSVAGANVTGQVNYAAVANSVAGANVSGAVAYATVANSVAGANVSGAVAFATTANSVAVANVVGLGNIATINLNGNSAQVLYGNGTFATISNVAVTANFANYAGNVTVASQPNITSVGTLTSLSVTGNITAGNAVLGNAVVANYFVGSGNNLSNIQGSNITGTVANANYSVYSGISSTTNSVAGANVSGQVSFAAVANSVAGANVSGAVAFATTANSVAGANVSGAVAFATTANSVAVANVTGIGNIATLNLTGSNSNVLYGNGAFAPVTNVAVSANFANFAGNVTVASQPNITSVGTLTSLSVTGNISSGNANLGNLTISNYFSGSGNLLSNIQGANVSGAVGLATYATTANSVAGANVSGQVANALIAGTVYTNAQPNITSVGTLTSLSITGNISSGNANLGNLVFANYYSGSGNLLSNIQGTNVSGAVGLATYATTANSVAGANVSGQVSNALIAGTVYTNAQPNITSVGTLTNLSVTGNISSGNANLGNLVTANYFSGDGGLLSNISATATNANFANFAGNVTVSSQPNITSVGTLVSLSVTGNISSGNANLGNLVTSNYFSGNGSLLTGITATASFPITSGNSNINAVANGNVTISSAGTANVLVVSGGSSAVYVNVGLTANALAYNTSSTLKAVPMIASGGQFQIPGGTTQTNANLMINGAGDLQANGNITIQNSNANVTLNAFSINHTWNNATASLNGIKINITPTANASTSYPLVIQNTGTNKLTVDVNGNVSGGNFITSGGSYYFSGGNITGQGGGGGYGAISLNAVANSIFRNTSGLKFTDGTSNILMAPSGNISFGVAGTANSLLLANTGASIATGTITTASNALNITSTWNNASATFNGATINITPTANAAGSYLINALNAGTSKFTVDVNGNIVSPGTSNVTNTVFTKYNETVIASANTSTSISPDVSIGTIFAYTANNNFTFNGFTNAVAGSSGVVKITQDSTGSRLMTSTMKFAGASKTLSTAANSVDIISVYYDGSTYYATLSKGYA